VTYKTTSIWFKQAKSDCYCNAELDLGPWYRVHFYMIYPITFLAKELWYLWGMKFGD